MLLRELISVWNEAVILFDSLKYKEAILKFDGITDQSAKIIFNIGNIHCLCNDYDVALKWFTKAVEKDTFLAVAYFQRAACYCKLKRYDDAEGDYHFTLDTLRGSDVIDYTQLGLPTKLYASQVLFNLAVSVHCQGRKDEARSILHDASQLSHNPFEQQVLSTGFSSVQNPEILTIPPKVFCPPRSAVSNLQKINFIGKAKVVSSSIINDDFVGFEGARKCHSNPTSPVPHRRQGDRLAVDNGGLRKGALTPPPGRPKLPPKAVPNHKSNPAKQNGVAHRLTPVPNDHSVSRSNDKFRSRSSENLLTVTGQSSRPSVPVLNSSSKSQEELRTRCGHGARPPVPKKPSHLVKKGPESSELKIKPPRPPPPDIHKNSKFYC